MRLAFPLLFLAILAIPASSASGPSFSTYGQFLLGGGPPTQCAAGPDVTESCVALSPLLATHGYVLHTSSAIPPQSPVYICFFASGLTLLRCDTATVISPDSTSIDTRGAGPLAGIPAGATLADIGGYGSIQVWWTLDVD